MPRFDENAPWFKSRSGIMGDYLEWPHLDLNPDLVFAPSSGRCGVLRVAHSQNAR